MFKHEKMLFRPVEVERPNPQYAALLQEQLGGGNGELKAAMQYMSQSFRIKDPEIKDLFLDIAAEELGHMEMVAQTINLLNGHDIDATQVPCGEIQSHVLLGLNPGLINTSGYSWTGDYVTVTGDLCADLLSNIASEQRAKVVYEYLYRQIDDKKVRETIDFLLNREQFAKPYSLFFAGNGVVHLGGRGSVSRRVDEGEKRLEFNLFYNP
jgi:Mn-containing catalase